MSLPNAFLEDTASRTKGIADQHVRMALVTAHHVVSMPGIVSLIDLTGSMRSCG
jgi:hypothetical protein